MGSECSLLSFGFAFGVSLASGLSGDIGERLCRLEGLRNWRKGCDFLLVERLRVMLSAMLPEFNL